MSLKSQIETAKDAVSKALITALENKDENVISDLFDVYNKLVSIRITETNKNTFSFNNYHDGYINCGAIGPLSTAGTDTISFTSSSLS
jgi:hypothetical protein